MDQEHEDSWRMRIYNKPLTARVKLVLLVVKLHLTAFNVDVYDCNCQNRTEDHLEEALRNVEEMSERIAEQDSTIQTLRKEVIMIIIWIMCHVCKSLIHVYC